MKTQRRSKPIVSAGRGETIKGTVIAIGSDVQGHAIMVEDAERKVWVQLRKSSYKSLMRSLAPAPLDGALSVMVTMCETENQDVLLADQVVAYVTGALTHGDGA